MKQYLELLQTIKEKSTHKPPAREGMPGSLSLFGYQFRHNLADGFPLLTTKKMYWKGIVIELLWFLRGDTNIKYLVDNGVNIWNEDAYNYYIKSCQKNKENKPWSFDDFIDIVKNMAEPFEIFLDYRVGDCGHQYGKLWRAWEGEIIVDNHHNLDGTTLYSDVQHKEIDQVKELIDGLKKNPMGRRHIITAWNPATLDKMALNACHVLVQFNCRPLSEQEKLNWLKENGKAQKIDLSTLSTKEMYHRNTLLKEKWVINKQDMDNIPQYYLDCQLYQRSADVFLGVPFNIASYALLIHILAKVCNMIPGEFVHTFGDVHIYDNHLEAVEEQLSREPRKLPRLDLPNNVNWNGIDEMIESCLISDFSLMGYDPYPVIKAELSTGLKK